MKRKMLAALLLTAACGGVFGISTACQATSINAAGVDQNDPSWRTATVAKPLDADGNNVYGSAGYLLFRYNSTASSATFTTTNGTSGTLNTLPSYLTVASTAATGPDSMYGGKATIDNPMGGTAASGIAYRSAGFNDNNNENYLTITIGSGFPASGIRLGILADNSGGNDAPTNIVLTQTTGGTAAASLANPNAAGPQEPDWYFFDITGASSGNVFTLALGNRTSGDKPTVGGITVDAIPEPGSLSLLAIGGLMMLRRRRSAGA